MKKNKMMTIPIVLIITLAFTGIAYAHWFDQVHIKGVVESGSLNLAFVYGEPPQTSEFYEDETGLLIPGEYLGKDVGSIQAHYEDLETDCRTAEQGYRTLIIDIDCAYPCYRGHTTFIPDNIGTIPVNICKYNITGEKLRKADDSKVCDLVYIPTDPDVPYTGDLYEDYGDGELIKVINLDITNSLPKQVDPKGALDKQEIDLHFKQEAQQCHRYKIYVTIFAQQWNKDCLFEP
jgi:hypothetical protein